MNDKAVILHRSPPTAHANLAASFVRPYGFNLESHCAEIGKSQTASVTGSISKSAPSSSTVGNWMIAGAAIVTTALVCYANRKKFGRFLKSAAVTEGPGHSDFLNNYVVEGIPKLVRKMFGAKTTERLASSDKPGVLAAAGRLYGKLLSSFHNADFTTPRLRRDMTVVLETPPGGITSANAPPSGLMGPIVPAGRQMLAHSNGIKAGYSAPPGTVAAHHSSLLTVRDWLEQNRPDSIEDMHVWGSGIELHLSGAHRMLREIPHDGRKYRLPNDFQIEVNDALLNMSGLSGYLGLKNYPLALQRYGQTIEATQKALGSTERAVAERMRLAGLLCAARTNHARNIETSVTEILAALKDARKKSVTTVEYEVAREWLLSVRGAVGRRGGDPVALLKQPPQELSDFLKDAAMAA